MSLLGLYDIDLGQTIATLASKIVWNYKKNSNLRQFIMIFFSKLVNSGFC